MRVKNTRGLYDIHTRPVYKQILKYLLPTNYKYPHVLTNHRRFYPWISEYMATFVIPKWSSLGIFLALSTCFKENWRLKPLFYHNSSVIFFLSQLIIKPKLHKSWKIKNGDFFFINNNKYIYIKRIVKKNLHSCMCNVFL